MQINTIPTQSNLSVLLKMEAAINAHDIDTFVNCFANDFVSEQPVHPKRNYTGSEHTREHWTAFFAQVPDLRAKLVTHTIAGDMGWSEWHWQGNQTNGTLICEALSLLNLEKTRSHGRGCIWSQFRAD